MRCLGVNDGCCKPDSPCGIGEGDCSKDEDCGEGLACGKDNCPWGDLDDCCYEKSAYSLFLFSWEPAL